MDIAIVGVVASLLVQWLKNKFGTGSYTTLGILAAMSLLGAAVYTYLVAAGYWESVLAVLMTASTFYSLIIARFE